MYKKITSFVMASYQELKQKLKAENSNLENFDLENSEEEKNTNIYIKESPTFELEEARYMLNLIADNDFKGRDVQIVYNIAFKLQEIIKKLKD